MNKLVISKMIFQQIFKRKEIKIRYPKFWEKNGSLFVIKIGLKNIGISTEEEIIIKKSNRCFFTIVLSSPLEKGVALNLQNLECI